MRRITQIGMWCGALLLTTAGSPFPVGAVGEPTKNVMIAELSPEAADSGTKEYITLFNPGAADVDLTGWAVQYRSASYKQTDAKGWSGKAVLGCAPPKVSDCATPVKVVLKAGETLRLSSYEDGEGVYPLASGMATTGGQVRLVQPITTGDQVVHDRVGYGTAVDFEGQYAAPAPKAGRSIVRLLDDKGAYADTDDNGTDFVLAQDEEETASGGGGDALGDELDPSSPDDGQVVYRDAEITEVLPDPVSPQLDSADEFVEIYNPHDEPLDLTGYMLKTGASWTHKYTIREVIVEPYEHVALMSAQTHLSLSNTGTGVRLYDPTGKLVFEVPSYGKAQPGRSWVRDAAGVWVWSAKATPGEQNVVELPAVAQSKPPASSTKKTTSKSAATKKPSTPKTATPAVKGVATTAAEQAAGSGGGNQVGLWVLGGAAVLALSYALFEYRQEIGGFVRRRWESLANFGGR